MSSNSSKPLLVYWDIRALASPIRLLLSYLEVDFEDRRIPFKELGPNFGELWFKEKYTHGLDFPNIPFYVDDEVKITQSMAILQHIGRKYNLYGDTAKDKATIDMVAQTTNDLRWSAWVAYNDTKFNDFKDDWKKTIPERWSEMEKFLEGKQFVLGDKVSWVDFLLYESVEWFRQFAMDIFEENTGLANINSFQKRIEALPQIKKYMGSEDYMEWPFFAPIVNFGYSKDPDFKPLPFTYRNFIARYPLDSV